jgi:hypothetical protein
MQDTTTAQAQVLRTIRAIVVCRCTDKFRAPVIIAPTGESEDQLKTRRQVCAGASAFAKTLKGSGEVRLVGTEAVPAIQCAEFSVMQAYGSSLAIVSILALQAADQWEQNVDALAGMPPEILVLRVHPGLANRMTYTIGSGKEHDHLAAEDHRVACANMDVEAYPTTTLLGEYMDMNLQRVELLDTSDGIRTVSNLVKQALECTCSTCVSARHTAADTGRSRAGGGSTTARLEAFRANYSAALPQAPSPGVDLDEDWVNMMFSI